MKQKILDIYWCPLAHDCIDDDLRSDFSYFNRSVLYLHFEEHYLLEARVWPFPS